MYKTITLMAVACLLLIAQPVSAECTYEDIKLLQDGMNAAKYMVQKIHSDLNPFEVERHRDQLNLYIDSYRKYEKILYEKCGIVPKR